jgi:hypothetical protein
MKTKNKPSELPISIIFCSGYMPAAVGATETVVALGVLVARVPTAACAFQPA